MLLKIVGVSVTYSCNGTRSASFDLTCKFSEREDIRVFRSDCVISLRVRFCERSIKVTYFVSICCCVPVVSTPRTLDVSGRSERCFRL